jgi:hypothetical protein
MKGSKHFAPFLRTFRDALKATGGRGGEGGQPIPSWPRVIFSIYPVIRPHSCISPPSPLPQLTCRKLNCTLVCTLCTVHPTCRFVRPASRTRPPILHMHHVPGFCQQRRRSRMKRKPGGLRGCGRRSVSRRGGVLLGSIRLISIR